MHVSNGVNRLKRIVFGDKGLFLAALFPIEIGTLYPIISLKCAEFFCLSPASGCAGVHPGGRRELRGWDGG